MSVVSARLLALGALLARRYGARAVARLVHSANAWLADPANEQAKAQLVAQLREWSRLASGGAARSAAALAQQVERRRVTVGAWERELMDLRHEMPGLPHGEVRDAAVRAYESQLRAGVHLIAHARNPVRTREQVVAALRAEGTMLTRERLTAAERERLAGAVTASVDACAAMFGGPAPGGPPGRP